MNITRRYRIAREGKEPLIVYNYPLACQIAKDGNHDFHTDGYYDIATNRIVGATDPVVLQDGRKVTQ